MEKPISPLQQVVNFLEEKNYHYKKVEHEHRVTVRYKTESIYGSFGWLDIYVYEADRDKCNLTIINIYPSCRRSVVCSFGQTYVSCQGYAIGKAEPLDKKQLVVKVERALSCYEIITKDQSAEITY